MAAGSAVFQGLRRNANRAAQLCSDFVNIGRHEGFSTAILVLSHRVARFAKYRLLQAGRERSALPQRHASLPPPESADLPAKRGVLFTGYVEANLGLGESLRGMINAVAHAGLPFGINPFNVNVETRVGEPFRPQDYDRARRYDVNVIETAADQLPVALEQLGAWRSTDSYTILRTYWELPTAPAEWAPFLNSIDEIWAPNAFVADAFRPIFPRPITLIPPCVALAPDAATERAPFKLSEGVFYFMFSFDYFSFPARKNPIGVLRAFQDTFPKTDKRVGLIIKSTGSQEHYPEIKAVIGKAARLDPRIVVVDRTLGRDEIVSLIACCDCYVSLHRSEGFGLGMVEAMALGKPVIGTDFSGSTDFLSPQTGYPVPYVLRPVVHGEYVYSTGQVWAEPDVAAASAAMRHVFANPAEARARAAAGRAFVSQRYGQDNVGRLVGDRLDELARQGRIPAPRSDEA